MEGHPERSTQCAVEGSPRTPTSASPLKHSLATILFALLLPLAATAQTPEDLLATFRNPPDSAKPMVRWWWFGPAVEKPEILRELQQMKADGIGGVELAFVYPLQLENNLPFLSTPMLEAVRYAQTEARALGLRVDLTLCSGWPYGGPSTTLQFAASHLRTLTLPIPPGASLPQPKLLDGDTIVATFTAPSNEPSKSTQITATYQPATTQNNVTFFIAGHTRQQVKRAAFGAEGYVLDPFSHAAVANHLKTVGEPLLSAFTPTPPTAIFSDSLEAYGADWTPDLPQQFKQRRGYDLLPHLQQLTATDPTPETLQIRHDYGQTLTELVNENYLTQINDFAKSHNTKFRSQTYGEPAVDFSSQSLVALPEGEGPQWRQFSTLRWATSANHVFGNNITSGETYTWLHSPVFRATPLDMKAEADIDFIMGENQLIFHGWPYSPPASQLPPGDPGWSLYAAAALNDHNPWHPVMPAVTAYITRISWLLRQGQPANQVAILLPTDDAWATFAPTSDKATQTPASVTAAMQKLLPKDLIPAMLNAGYNFDFIDAKSIASGKLSTDVILSEAKNPSSSARAASGLRYQILILPPTARIPAETLTRLVAFQKSGGKLIALGHLPTLDAAGHPLSPIDFIPLIPDSTQLPKALHNAAPPDLQLASPIPALGFIHRKLPTADIYFLTNTGNQPLSTSLTLGNSNTPGRQLDPDTGLPVGDYVFSKMQLSLAPYESRVFIFDSPHLFAMKVPRLTSVPLLDLTHNWTVTFPTLHKTLTQPTPTDWTASPDTLHYSGEAIYTRDFTLPTAPKGPTYLEVSGGVAIPGAPNSEPDEHVTRAADGLPNPLVTGTGPGMHAWYDPPIREAALVFIKGQPAGALWHPPYRLDVTNLLKAGPNHIEIRVFNTALNAWSAIPPRDYTVLKAKYGDRFQMQDLKDVRPLPSGLLGPIHLIQGLFQ